MILSSSLLSPRNRYAYLDDNSIYFSHAQLFEQNKICINFRKKGKYIKMTEDFYKHLCAIDGKNWKKEDVEVTIISGSQYRLPKDNIRTKKITKITFSNNSSLLMFLLSLES